MIITRKMAGLFLLNNVEFSHILNLLEQEQKKDNNKTTII